MKQKMNHEKIAPTKIEKKKRHGNELLKKG